MRDFRKYQKMAKKVISLKSQIILQLLLSDHSIAEMVYIPTGNPISHYIITHNVYLKICGYEPNSLEDTDLTKMKKISRLRTEKFPVNAGIVTEHLAVVLSSGYRIITIEGSDINVTI